MSAPSASAVLARDLLSAIRTCLASGTYPDREALFAHGARGDWPRMKQQFDTWVADGSIELPDWAAKSYRRATAAPPPEPRYRSNADIRAYRRAWRGIRANRAEVVDMVLMQPVIEEEEEVVDVV